MSNITTSSSVEKEDPYETAKTMHWYTSVVVGSIFVFIGLFGNILSIAVWNRKRMRSSTGRYLIAQAIADIGVLIFFFLMDSLKVINTEINTSYAYGVFHSYIGYPFLYLAVICSIWFTVGVTVDRYIMVCLIKHAKDMCNEKRATVGVAIITILCFVINLPHFGTYEPVRDVNGTKVAYEMTEFGGGHGSQMYEFWVHCMFLVLVPWITIAILNGLIIRRVIRTGKKVGDKKSEEAKDKQKRSERQVTTLLLTITFSFLILIALQCIVQCFFMLQPKSVDLVAVNESFAIAKLGVVINSSINFLLYCLSARRFRHELLTMFDGVCGIRVRGGFSTFSTSKSSSRTTSSC